MLWLYGGFILFVVVMLLLDLFVVNRQDREISVKRSLVFTGVTVLLSLSFAVAVYFIYDNHFMGIGKQVLQLDGTRSDLSGKQAVIEYITGYLVEYSLSMDNIFVISLIFTHLTVPRPYQHRVLFWGVMGALIMRGIMIAVGAALVSQFQWVLYIMGAFLVFSGIKMLRSKEDEQSDDEKFAFKLARRMLPLTKNYHGHNFVAIESGKRVFTPLMLALLVVELTDVVFAVDSIPAIFAITLDPFLVFTSNVFAILGLRSLFFALQGLLEKFHLLKVSLSLVLVFIGIKMLLPALKLIGGPDIHLTPAIALSVIAAILLGGVLGSLLFPKPAKANSPVLPGAN